MKYLIYNNNVDEYEFDIQLEYNYSDNIMVYVYKVVWNSACD